MRIHRTHLDDHGLSFQFKRLSLLLGISFNSSFSQISTSLAFLVERSENSCEKVLFSTGICRQALGTRRSRTTRD